MTSSAGSSRGRRSRGRRVRDEERYFFDRAAADHVCDFFELLLVHTTGEWAGQPFKLRPWQRKLLRTAFGWKRRSDGLRRYRRVYLKVPRKNGKSTLAAGVALYLTFADREPRAEVYGAANDKDQAGIVFREAKRMIEASPALREQCSLFRSSIVVPDTLASYQVLSSESSNKDGLNIHGLVVDELHELHDRDLWEKLTTAMGSRRQPMTFIATTAGVGREGVYAELDAHARRVLDGTADDDELLAVVYQAEPGDDWRSKATWRKANPNYGVSVKPDFLAAQCRQAVLVPGYENAFKRYHLNLDTEQDVRWLNMESWDACGGEIDADELACRPCWIGLDLSRRVDLTAAVLLFPDGDRFLAVPRFWVPREGLDDKGRRDGVPLRSWVDQGLVTATDGSVIDYSYIRQELLEAAKRYDVREVAYDPYSATQLALQLQDDGLTCVEHRQGFVSMSEPAKKLEELVLRRRLLHGGNPVLRWNIGNVTIETDAAGNIKPSKRKSTGRIDGVVALIMAISRATLQPVVTSVYERRGLLTM